MKVADYTSSPKTPLSLRVSYHSASDLLCTLWILGDRAVGEQVEELDLGDEWFDAIEDGLSAETRLALDAIGCGDVWVAMLPFLPEMGEGGTIDGFIAAIADMDPPDLRYRFIKLHDKFGDDDREVLADAAEGRPGAVDRLLDLPAYSDSGLKAWRETLRYLLSMEPEQTRSAIVNILRRTQDEVFARHEAEFRPLLKADFDAKRAMARRIAPERLLEIATSGINFSEDHARKPIVLIPTMVARPWVVFSAGPDYFVLGYPVADEYLEEGADAPPKWLVKLHKALGDERRLRILRTLAEGDASLADLAESVDIAKSTLHHHLMLLRAAGLVRLHVGQEKRYSLRDNTIVDAAAVLDHYIHPTHQEPEDA